MGNPVRSCRSEEWSMGMVQPEKFTFPVQIRELLFGMEVYCSFSGGADSLALLIFLQEQQKLFSYTLKAVHFEHGFRGEESLADERFCRNFCRGHSIPFESYSLAVPEHRLPGEGDEEASRRLRLECWKYIIKDPEKSLIALAHHAGDRVENVLLRLFRGSNVSGLSSLRAVQKVYGLTLIRPFLEYTREELLSFLKARKIDSFCHDSTNDSSCYGRNFIRLELLPDIVQRFPFALDGIRQSVRVLEEDARCLETLAADLFRQNYREDGTLSLAFLKARPKALRIRILTNFLHQKEELRSFLPDHSFYCNFESLLERAVPGKIPLHGKEGYFLELRHGFFRITPSGEETPEPFPVRVWDVLKENQCGFLQCEILAGSLPEKCGVTEAFFDLDSLALPLTVRSWKAGDRILPFGRNHPVSLKKLFAEKKIAGAERNNYPLVFDKNSTLLFAAGLRHSSICPVAAQTARVLHIFLQSVKE